MKRDLIIYIKKLVASFIFVLSISIPVAAADSGTVILYQETDSGTAPYLTRLIITKRYLRFDDGKDNGDFLLFDRKKKKIYNTNSTDKTILVISEKKISLPEKKSWTHDVDSDNEKVPAIGDMPVRHLVLLTNNKICYDLYAAKGLLTDATAALAEYRRVLSIQHAEIMMDMPGIERSVCDLANNIYLPDRHLRHGFPVRIRDMDGRGKLLQSYKKIKDIDSKLFRLPENFRKFTISEFRQ